MTLLATKAGALSKFSDTQSYDGAEAYVASRDSDDKWWRMHLEDSGMLERQRQEINYGTFPQEILQRLRFV